jgi:hypothetical protein
VLAAAPFVVTNGLACWYDASVGVTTNGSGVMQTWSDQSGLGHLASRISGSPTRAPNDVNGRPAVHLVGNNSIFDCAGAMFTKEQYVVVRSPNATWNGSGSFLARKGTGNSGARASSYNLYSGYTGFWDDQLPTAVSKNGTAVLSGQGTMPRGGFQLGTITDYMILKITVNANADAANLAQYPYYQIGRNDNLGSCDMYIAEIISYTNTLSSADEAKVGSYLADKYGLTTAYPTLTGPSATALVNSPATGVTNASAVLHATLGCTGAVYSVVAFWNTVNGGTNAGLWANSAYVGSWTNAVSTNLSFTATGLAPNTPYYFTFRATNAVDTLWAANVQSFTTVALLPPPTPVLPVSGVKVTNGVPSFTFIAAAGYKYRLDYKNALTNGAWTLGPWTTNSTLSPMLITLTDAGATNQPQRFYRLEAANP